MKERVISQVAIAALSKELGSRLGPHGFVRKRQHLFRLSETLIHAVSFQASQWGDSESTALTINLAVSEPTVFRLWTGRPFPSNPATAQFPICLRIGRLLPDGRDHWWNVDRSTDLDQFSETIASLVCPLALQFFEPYPSAPRLLSILNQDEALPGILAPQRPFVSALLAAAIGDIAQARELLDGLTNRSTDAPFAAAIATIQSRIENLDPK